MRRWYRDNEEAVRAYNAAHLSEHAASARTYYQRHRVRIREDRLKADRTYRQKHREEINHRRRLRYRLNPEPVLARSRRYYALRAAAPGSHTTAEWQDLQALYGYRCLRCGRQDRRLTPDHVVPLSRGGSDDIDNIQPLCLPCNIGKHARTIDYRPAASS